MIRILLRFIKKLIILFFLLSILSVIIFRYIPVYFTTLMGIRIIEQIRDKKSPKLQHTWVGYDDISDNLKRAVIASEDQLFFTHKGFDKKQIQKALVVIIGVVVRLVVVLWGAEVVVEVLGGGEIRLSQILQ